MLYKDQKGSNYNNFLNTFFHIKKDVRRIDPLFPTTFILCTEHLAIMLRQNTQFRGLKMCTELVKVSLFADNTEIYLNNSPTHF